MATNLRQGRRGALPADPGILELERQLAIDALEADLVGAGDLGQPAAACLLLAQDHPPVDHVSRPRIPHVLQSHLEPELASRARSRRHGRDRAG